MRKLLIVPAVVILTSCSHVDALLTPIENTLSRGNLMTSLSEACDETDHINLRIGNAADSINVDRNANRAAIDSITANTAACDLLGQDNPKPTNEEVQAATQTVEGGNEDLLEILEIFE